MVGRDLDVIDLGRLNYAAAYERQSALADAIIEGRDASPRTLPRVGYLLLVEHDPVITVSRRAGAADHLLATPERLAREGVEVRETDRGGDITYHGPGQLVVYPILDLNVPRLGLHAYMRLLEEVVITVCRGAGVETFRDPGATGVWVPRDGSPHAKIAAMGVRLRRWVSLHGLALNVTTNLAHFDLIVPCGLVGRPVTSLQRELGARCPSMDAVKAAMVAEFERLLA